MANYRIVTGPTTEPVTLAETKSQGRFSDSENDGDMAACLITARASIERACTLAMITQTWDLVIDYTWPYAFDRAMRGGFQRIEIPIAPLQSVESISYVDSNGSLQTLAADQYRVLRTGLHNRRGVIEPAYGVSWPGVRFQLEAITVRFVAGFGAAPEHVPEPVRHAIKLLASHYMENREPVVVGTSIAPLPMAIASLLADYNVGGSPEALGGV